MARNGRNRNTERETPVETWQATYASLAMILVVFFVMLASYARVSEPAALRMRAAVAAKTNPAAPAAAAERSEDRDAGAGPEAGRRAAHLAEAGGMLRGAVEKANLSRDVILEKTRSGWRVILGRETLFDENRGEIRETMHPFLREVGSAAKRAELAVRVEVFAPAASEGRLDRPSWAMPAARAASVIGFLEREEVRSPLSLRGHASVRPSANAAAGNGGDVVLTVSPASGVGS